MTVRSFLAILLVQALILLPLQAGLGSKSAEYVGGTWTQYKQGLEGKLDVSKEDKAIFTPNKGAPSEIPFGRITSLEYGQKAGRRVGATIGWGVTTLGLAALPILLSKKRKHFLTIGWTDDAGKPAGVVLELGKEITRGTIQTFSVRSGKAIEYESDDAKKNIGN